MSLACETCPVRDRAACAALSPADRAALARSGRHRTLASGETLFAAGGESAACATLVTGALKVTALDSEGNETILALIHPAGFVGEMFSPFVSHEVVAITESEVCLFSRSELEAAIARHPALGAALLRRVQEDLHAARDLLDLTNRRDAAARVAGLMLALARSASDSPCHPAQYFDLPLNRGDIAAMLGLTIETVSRKIGWLEAQGAIRRTSRRGVEIRDHALLTALAV
jgi:CRP/FNR family transcriptional regulator, anaerobic regulatory protein